MQLKLGDLIASPDHFLFAFDKGQAVFLKMDRAAYARSIFVDGRISSAEPQRLSVDAALLGQLLDQTRVDTPQTTGWIFHIAHCGSTLLARALDVPGDLVIREPLAIRQLALDGIQAGRDPAWTSRLRLATRMLGRRYAADAPAIVKANVPVNFILDDIMTMRPSAPTILLYHPLETYLLAILRSDSHRSWVAAVTADLNPALEAIEPIAGQIIKPAVAAARLWLVQMRIFNAALSRYPQTVSLDAETFFETPRPVLEAATRHFGVKVDAASLDWILESGLFSTYSKKPDLAFDNASRVARQTALRHQLSTDLILAKEWVLKRTADRPLPDRLTRPLTGRSPVLVGSF